MWPVKPYFYKDFRGDLKASYVSKTADKNRDFTIHSAKFPLNIRNFLKKSMQKAQLMRIFDFFCVKYGKFPLFLFIKLGKNREIFKIMFNQQSAVWRYGCYRLFLII